MDSSQTDGLQDDLKELEKIRLQNEKEAQSLNQFNPLSKDFASGVDPAALSEAVKDNPQLATAIQILNHPLGKKLLKVATDPSIRQLGLQVAKHPQQQTLIYIEGGWLLAYLLFRFWFSMRFLLLRWWLRILGRLVAFILFIMIGSWFLPSRILGDGYNQLLRNIYQILTN
jgi:hypothetical protein